MKKIILFTILIGCQLTALAQDSCVPDFLHLTAVARDNNGVAITSQIDVKVEISQGDLDNGGTLLYCEQTQNIQPNSAGEFSLDFGAPELICNPPAVLMENVDWRTCEMWYKLSWRQTGSPVYTPIVSNRFSSIPFAFASRYAENGKVENAVGADEINFIGPNGSSNVTIHHDEVNYPSHGMVRVSNDEGITKAAMFSDGSWSGSGRVSTFGENGSNNVALSIFAIDEPDFGAVRIYDDLGNLKVFNRAISDGSGAMTTYGDNGTALTFAGYSTSGGHSRGGVYVYGSDNSSVIGGMRVNTSNQAELFGQIKSFRMEHPQDPEKEIWYASVEGPEAAAYDRGTATLVDGEAFVDFSDHYQLVANTETMTVVLTPLSADSKGMAVIEKTPRGIRVKELGGGTGNYSFDWRVECVRKGFEDFQVIRDKMIDPITGKVEGEK